MARFKYAIAAALLVSKLWAQAPTPPVQSQAPDETSSPAPAAPPAVTPPPDSSVLVATKKVKPEYPPAAAPHKLHGQVIVGIVVGETGDVESAEIVSGNPILANAAVDAVKQWKFKPFIRNGQVVKAVVKLPFDFAPSGAETSVGPKTGPENTDTPNSTPQPKAITARLTNVKPDGVDLGPLPPGTIRVQQSVTQGMVTHRVDPQYPAVAKAARLTGVVLLGVHISKDGTVKDVTVVSGHPVLVQAAIAAVRQWRYRPYVFNGELVEVQTAVTVTFPMAESRWGTLP